MKQLRISLNMDNTKYSEERVDAFLDKMDFFGEVGEELAIQKELKYKEVEKKMEEIFKEEIKNEVKQEKDQEVKKKRIVLEKKEIPKRRGGGLNYPVSINFLKSESYVKLTREPVVVEYEGQELTIGRSINIYV